MNSLCFLTNDAKNDDCYPTERRVIGFSNVCGGENNILASPVGIAYFDPTSLSNYLLGGFSIIH